MRDAGAALDFASVPTTATSTMSKASAAVCQNGAARAGKRLARVGSIMIETIALATPVLAAGWSLLYLLFGGGIFGALVIFFGLKALGH